jgi:hypothetical protein
LRDGRTSSTSKSAAGSALSQAARPSKTVVTKAGGDTGPKRKK